MTYLYSIKESESKRKTDNETKESVKVMTVDDTINILPSVRRRTQLCARKVPIIFRKKRARVSVIMPRITNTQAMRISEIK
jgi:hypothetical protein